MCLHTDRTIVTRRHRSAQQRRHRLDVGGQPLLYALLLQQRLLPLDAVAQLGQPPLGRRHLSEQGVELLPADHQHQFGELANVELSLDTQLNVVAACIDAPQFSDSLVRRAGHCVLQRYKQLPHVENALLTLLHVRLEGALHSRARP